MPHLGNDEFLTRLEQLFADRKDHGSVFLVQKRMTYEDEPAAPSTSTDADLDMPSPADRRPQDPHEREWPVLLRATAGKAAKDTKVKLTTVVQPQDLTAFLDRYSLLLRTTFTAALRPKRKRAAAQRRTKGGDGPLGGGGEGAAVSGGAAAGAAPLEPRRAGAGAAAGAGAGAGAFRPGLPKVVGPRRGNGVQKRRRAERRRKRALERIRRRKTPGGPQR